MMELKNGVETVVKEIIKGFNLYTLPQYLWLILMYYLMLNAFLEILSNKFGVKQSNFIPEIILNKNTWLMDNIAEWSNFLGFIALSLIVAAFFIDGARHLYLIKNYEKIHHAGIGLPIGGWLLLSYITYQVYDWNKILFVFSILILFIFTGLIDYLKKHNRGWY